MKNQFNLLCKGKKLCQSFLNITLFPLCLYTQRVVWQGHVLEACSTVFDKIMLLSTLGDIAWKNHNMYTHKRNVAGTCSGDSTWLCSC